MWNKVPTDPSTSPLRTYVNEMGLRSGNFFSERRRHRHPNAVVEHTKPNPNYNRAKSRGSLTHPSPERRPKGKRTHGLVGKAREDFVTSLVDFSWTRGIDREIDILYELWNIYRERLI